MNEQVTVWFPSFQKTAHTLHKIAFTLFGKFEVRWYGILITLGMILAFAYIGWRGKKNEGIVFDNVIDVGILTVILGILGARVYYVLTSLGDYHTFYDAIAIWNGGLAIYGGVIGGFTGLFIMCAVKKINWRKFLDATTPAVLFAQALGRWGNFFNGEAYGSQIADTTQYYFFLKKFDLPSGEGTLFHFLRMGLYPNDFSRYEMVFVHPTFLYESIWNLVGFIWINLVYKHKKFDGQVALLYFSWYGFGRMFIEGFRSDSLYIGGNIRISQLVGLLCFVACTTLLIVGLVRSRRKVAAPEPAPQTFPEAPAESAAEQAKVDSIVNRVLDRLLRRKLRKPALPEETPAEATGNAEDPLMEDFTTEDPATEAENTENSTDSQPPVA